MRHIQSPNPLLFCAPISNWGLDALESSRYSHSLALSANGAAAEAAALTRRDDAEGTTIDTVLLGVSDDARRSCVDDGGDGGVKVCVRASLKDSLRN